VSRNLIAISKPVKTKFDMTGIARNIPPMDLAERLEVARTALGWSQRQMGREAGLRHETNYAAVLFQFKRGGSARIPTIDPIVARLVKEGWSEEWLRHGIGPQRQAVATPVQPATVAAPPARRSFTPTPAPSSELRVSQHTHLVIPRLPNRERAAKLLVDRGLAAAEVDESLALVAFDARLAPCEDPPVSWWLDAMRDRVQRA
jgi:hypothetical protein